MHFCLLKYAFNVLERDELSSSVGPPFDNEIPSYATVAMNPM